jgi:Pentapeptide repeats (9 copies)
LSGARLPNAQLQGALLTSAQMQGTDLSGAQMQGTRLALANLKGARLFGASMQATDLRYANLRGADLRRTQLQGADLREAHLEGTNLDQSSLTLARFWHAHTWQATGANCHDAQVVQPRFNLTERSMAWPDAKEKFIEDVVSDVPQKIQHQVRKRLTVAVEHDDTKDVWRACETKALPREDYDRKHADYVVELACKSAPHDHKYVVYGIYGHWIEEPDEVFHHVPFSLTFGPNSMTHVKTIIRGLVGEECPVAKELGERIFGRLVVDAKMMQGDSQ